MTETETTKCHACDFDNAADAKICASPRCGVDLKSEIECLRSIDPALSEGLAKLRHEQVQANGHLKTIKRVAVWFLVLSMLALLLAILEALMHPNQ
jgi:hypothetical protein